MSEEREYGSLQDLEGWWADAAAVEAQEMKEISL